MASPMWFSEGTLSPYVAGNCFPWVAGVSQSCSHGMQLAVCCPDFQSGEPSLLPSPALGFSQKYDGSPLLLPVCTCVRCRARQLCP